MRWFGYVSLERVQGYLLRFHPSGKGAGSPHTFSCVVAKVDDEWELKGATGVGYKRSVSEAIRWTLSRAGFQRVRRLSGYGARERVITTEAVKMKTLVWQAAVTHDGNSVGGQMNWWNALPQEDVDKMVQQGTDAVSYAKSMEEKNGGKGYVITFTGSVTDTDTGAIAKDPPVTVELSEKNLAKYLKKANKLGDFMVDWAQDDVDHGKKTGWDHTKAKKPKAGAEDEPGAGQL